MEKKALGAAAPNNVGLLDHAERHSPLRVRLGTLLLSARSQGNRVDERYAERLFWIHVIGPANADREIMAQIFKRDDLESVTPVKATERFCQLLHAEVARFDAVPTIKRNLFDNSLRAINQIWHSRQLADMHGLEYEVFVPRLVALVAQGTRGRIKAVDLPRVADRLAERLSGLASTNA